MISDNEYIQCKECGSYYFKEINDFCIKKTHANTPRREVIYEKEYNNTIVCVKCGCVLFLGEE